MIFGTFFFHNILFFGDKANVLKCPHMSLNERDYLKLVKEVGNEKKSIFKLVVSEKKIARSALYSQAAVLKLLAAG